MERSPKPERGRSFSPNPVEERGGGGGLGLGGGRLGTGGAAPKLGLGRSPKLVLSKFVRGGSP